MANIENHVGNWIQTFGNRKFWPLDPKPEHIFIDDIAHALSNKCRFSGHTKRFYSVAQHSVLVSQFCDKEDALWGLLHDGSEAYLIDMPKPLKILPEFAWFVAAENKVQDAISMRFGLSQAEPESVYVADKALLMSEKRDLMGYIPWDEWQIKPKEQAYDIKIDPMQPEDAERLFLARFAELTQKFW